MGQRRPPHSAHARVLRQDDKGADGPFAGVLRKHGAAYGRRMVDAGRQSQAVEGRAAFLRMRLVEVRPLCRESARPGHDERCCARALRDHPSVVQHAWRHEGRRRLPEAPAEGMGASRSEQGSAEARRTRPLRAGERADKDRAARGDAARKRACGIHAAHD